MTIRSLLSRIVLQEDLNFLLTNRVPRQLLTLFMGWFSQIEQPLVRDLSIATWKLFADLDLSDARKTEFRSLHDCFTRQLKPGARPVNPDPELLTSPSDGIVGACGAIAGTPRCSRPRASPTACSTFSAIRRWSSTIETGVTSRCASPRACTTASTRQPTANPRVTYISGDTWNANPIALKRVEKLFCKMNGP